MPMEEVKGKGCMDSILESIKKLIGYDRENTEFDSNLIMLINGRLNDLTQAGVGNLEGFTIRGYDETWQDFVGESKLAENAKIYVYARTKLDFDPPASTAAITALEKSAEEAIWRLST